MADKASRYISEGGRTADYGKDQYAEDLLCVASFLVWAEGEYFAGYTGADAYQAFMRLIDRDPIMLRKIVKGEV